MGKLKELSERLEKLSQEVMSNKVITLVKVHENEATNLNTDQLFGGMDSEGKSLPDYSPRSVAVFGKPAGPIRLFDEGDFYRGFFVKTENDNVIFDSKDSKSTMLKKRYGGDIFGLTQANIKELARVYILPDLQKFVRETIKG